MKSSISEEVQGTLTTVQMIQRDGRAPELDLVTAGREVEVLEELIQELAAMRSQLSPAVADQLHRRVPLRVVTRARFTVGRTHGGHLLLAMRDPGLGWLGFSVDEGVRTYLLDALGSPSPSGLGTLRDAA